MRSKPASTLDGLAALAMVDAVRSVLTGANRDLAPALIWAAALIAVCRPIAIVRYRHA